MNFINIFGIHMSLNISEVHINYLQSLNNKNINKVNWEKLIYNNKEWKWIDISHKVHNNDNNERIWSYQRRIKLTDQSRLRRLKSLIQRYKKKLTITKQRNIENERNDKNKACR